VPGPAAKLDEQKLDQMMAPIALYPDQLLSQILMASTYPLEVVEAARWTHEPAHRQLHGDTLFKAMKDKGWDPSVMALVPFTKVLDMMNERLDWMTSLGAAFVAQQADAMAAVQRLRRLAMAAGSLKQTPQCHCVIGTQGETITIAAAQTGPVCIPTYNTHVVYGHWPYPAYPPVVFPAPAGVAWVPGAWIGYYPVADLAWAGPLWGWGRIDWLASRIIVDPARYAFLATRDPGFSGGVWRFDPARRGAVTALAATGAFHAAAAANRAAAAAPDAAMFRAGRNLAGARAFGRAPFAARSGGGRFAGAAIAPGRAFASRHFAGRGRFRAGGMPYAARGGGRFGGFRGARGGHFGAAHFGGFGGGGAHFGGPASFGLGGGGGHGGGHFGGGHFGGGHGGGGHGGGGRHGH
jgi:hypothetical protein